MLTRSGIEEVQRILATVTSTSSETVQLVDRARGKLSLVLLDGSMGFHNKSKTSKLIAEAKRLAEEAAASR
jgi:hypothetical protein